MHRQHVNRTMRTVRYHLILACVLLLAAVPAATARVGELLGNCRKRYGDPIAVHKAGKITTRTYRKGEYLVDVYFIERTFVLVYHTERAVGIAFRKPRDKKNQPLAESEIRTFLRANGRGESWLPMNLLFEAARQSSPTERDRLIEESRRYIMWKQPDGTLGIYDITMRELVIRTPEMARATSAEQKERAPRHRPIGGLEGF